MASKQTTHYQLSQWEATDAVVRRDFNDDNAKIDAALYALAEGKAEDTDVAALVEAVSENLQKETADVAALRNENCWVKLKTLTTGASNKVSIDTSGVNWSQYQRAELIGSIQGTNTAAVLKMRLNNRSDAIYTEQGSGPIQTELTVCRNVDGGLFQVMMGGVRPSGRLMGEINYVGGLSSASPGRVDFSVSGLLFSQISSIQLFFESGLTFLNGSEITLYGLKR